MSTFECAMIIGFMMIFKSFTVIFLNPHTQENRGVLKISNTCFAFTSKFSFGFTCSCDKDFFAILNARKREKILKSSENSALQPNRARRFICKLYFRELEFFKTLVQFLNSF
jgi:hypothetical protein